MKYHIFINESEEYGKLVGGIAPMERHDLLDDKDLEPGYWGGEPVIDSDIGIIKETLVFQFKYETGYRPDDKLFDIDRKTLLYIKTSQDYASMGHNILPHIVGYRKPWWMPSIVAERKLAKKSQFLNARLGGEGVSKTFYLGDNLFVKYIHIDQKNLRIYSRYLRIFKNEFNPWS